MYSLQQLYINIDDTVQHFVPQIASGERNGEANVPLARHPDTNARPEARGPRKIPSSEDLIYINPKTDPKLMQIEKKKVFIFYLFVDFSSFFFDMLIKKSIFLSIFDHFFERLIF